MKILKKENAWIWLILLLLTTGTSTFILGALLDVYDSNAWYYKWTKKVPKLLLKILFILFIIFYISVSVISLLITSEIISPITINSKLNLLISLIALALLVAVTVFTIQILCETASKLEVKGKEIYLSPFIWLLFIIVPIIGWVLFIVMVLYLEIFIIVSLYKGNGEKYLKKNS